LGALLPDVADAAVIFFFVLKVTKLINFDIYEETTLVGVGTFVIYIFNIVFAGIEAGIRI